MDINGFTNIDEIVQNYKLQRGEDGMVNYLRYYQFVIRGLQKINLLEPTGIKCIYLDIDTTMNWVKQPLDYVDYIRIGIDVNGRLHTITKNENIIIAEQIKCGVPYRDVNTVNKNVKESYSMAGSGGGFNMMYFREDTDNRYFWLEGTIPTGTKRFYMEYKTSGVSLTKETIIPMKLQEPLITWVAWKDVELDDSVSPNEKNMRETQFGKAMDDLDSIDFRMDLENYKDFVYRNTKGTMKI